MTFGEVNIWTAILLFGLYLVFDSLYTLYVHAISQYKALRATVLSMVIYLISVYGTIEYINNFVYILPIALGGAIGTYITIRITKRNSEKQKQEGE